jgi:pterin-4a-carbinolamine dehydratase
MTSILKEIIANQKNENSNTIEEKAIRGPFASAIKPEKRELPIQADSKWKVIEENDSKFLEKTFVFVDLNKRTYFIGEILAKEEETRHFAHIEIYKRSVKITLQTKNIDVVTELDKEYSKFIDTVYTDIIL